MKASVFDAIDSADAAVRSWRLTYGDGDGDLRQLDTLRRASYALAKENPIAVGGIQTHVSETIGTGLELQCRLDRTCLRDCVGLEDDDADAWEEKTESRFRMWAESHRDCDVEGQLNLYELQALMMRTELLAGDGLAVIPRIERKHSPFTTRVQTIDPSRLSNKNRAMDTTRLAGGVRRDGSGYVVAYDIMRSHPHTRKAGAERWTWDTVRAVGLQTGRPNVVHLFDKQMSGGSRGRPILAPMITTIHQIGKYTDAEVMAAVANAFFALFTETSEASAGGALNHGELDDTAGGLVDPDAGEVAIKPGTMVDLPAGRKLSSTTPGRPNDKFDGFVDAMLKQVGMALNIPVEVLTKHFQSSYSAARAALLQYWKTVLTQRRHLSLGFCQPVYVAWLMEEVASGRIEAPGFFTDPFVQRAWTQSAWVGPPRGMIRPDQEVTAELAMHEATIKPLADITLQLTGQDWDVSVHRIAREQRKLERLGLGGTLDSARLRADQLIDPDDPKEDE